MPRKARSQRFHRPKRRMTHAPKEVPETDEDINEPLQQSLPEQPSPGLVNPVEESSSVFTLDASSGPAPSYIEVPCPSAASLSAALRKLSSLLPSDWIATADKKGFYVMLLSSGGIKVILRQVFVSFLGNASVHVQCYPCPLFDEVFSLLHSPKVFSLNSLDEFCQSVLALVEIVIQYTNCVGLNYLDVQKVRDNHPEVRIDSYPFVEEGCRDTCRSTSCALLVPRETDDVRCEACLNLLKWVQDRVTEEL
ncbi:uncharacterized protein LOC117640025 [Thrips palmi]|uniref:Uncharacterized protein LOC117640025 n=1 Tax=Thrips palmi TaxID=161013 RepID=A0A6P8Y7Q5_THRPL|nr:uncharacterized protein LOC117640025 [Thrips palmi]XP_034232101.1 uncharacterized protein LOC117640025 [Thrips palmi]